MTKYSLCPLCFFPAKKIQNDDYHTCRRCGAIFLSKNKRLSFEEEKARYEKHNNDIQNVHYRKFVSPISSIILQEQKTKGIGLDFGSGTGPVVSAILKEKGYKIFQYDPFFANNKNLLKNEYDYIACCEVAEHFRNPRKEFQILKKLLKPGGSLYLMTDIYHASINFQNWNYRNDQTHIFIYRQKTFNYILKKFKFKTLKISDRLIVLKN